MKNNERPTCTICGKRIRRYGRSIWVHTTDADHAAKAS